MGKCIDLNRKFPLNTGQWSCIWAGLRCQSTSVSQLLLWEWVARRRIKVSVNSFCKHLKIGMWWKEGCMIIFRSENGVNWVGMTFKWLFIFKQLFTFYFYSYTCNPIDQTCLLQKLETGWVWSSLNCASEWCQTPNTKPSQHTPRQMTTLSINQSGQWEGVWFSLPTQLPLTSVPSLPGHL